MKRTTREWLRRLVKARLTVYDLAQDALDSDARLRAENRELRAALRDIATPDKWSGFGMRRIAIAALTPKRARAARGGR